MKTKLSPLALLIPSVVLAQPAPQAPQPFQATPPGMNQQVNPTNSSNSSAGTAAKTLNKQNSGPLSPPANPVAAAAYEKASKTTKTMGSSKKTACTDGSYTVGSGTRECY